MTEESMRSIVASRRVLVVCGTGGVGKTTVSAALALGAARAGRRALVMTIDPARRLAEALGVDGRMNEPTRIDVPGLPEGGELVAMMLDAKSTFDSVVRRFAPSEQAAEAILANEYYQRASSTLSGSQEYMAMEKLLEVHDSGRWDLVILDTPPTRNALDFLEAPGRMMRIVEQGAMRWLSGGTEGGRFSPLRAGLRIFGKGREKLFEVFERFTGVEVVQGLGEFASAFSGLMPGFRERAGAVHALMASDRTAFLMVASPNRVALAEAVYFHDRLGEGGMPFRGFVINRVAALRNMPGRTPSTPWEAGFEPRPEDPCWNAALESVWANHRRRIHRAADDREQIEALRGHCGEELLYVEVPELDRAVHDLPALEELREWLGL